jgi:hypothetical protein
MALPCISSWRRCAAAVVGAALLAGVSAPQPVRAQLEPIVPGPSKPVSLELVLAVDTSSSVSLEEFDLQMRGFANAFRSPPVLAAISATGGSGVAVAMIQWSDNRRQALAIDWSLLVDEPTTLAFAETIDQTPRFLDGGGTAIGGAIAYSLRVLEGNGFEGTRKVIDISGDGRANQGAQPDDLRDRAVARGVTVNGLAILNEDSSVADYYRSTVIGGGGAFVITANDYESFAEAILHKLVREIGGVPVARAVPPPAPQLAGNAAPGTVAIQPPRWPPGH